MIIHKEFLMECCQVAEYIRGLPVTYEECLQPTRKGGVVFARHLYILFRLEESKNSEIAKEFEGVIDRTIIPTVARRTIFASNKLTRKRYLDAQRLLKSKWESIKAGKYYKTLFDLLSVEEQINVLKQTSREREMQILQSVELLISALEVTAHDLSNNKWAQHRILELIKQHRDRIDLATNRRGEDTLKETI